MDIFWGIQNDNEIDNLVTSNKRQKVSNSEDEYNRNSNEVFHPLIYSSGKRVHFAAGVNKLNIELLIKEFEKIIRGLYKNEDKTKSFNITYIVDTPGGSVSSALKFVDYIRMTKLFYCNLTFTSIITGLVASAGTTISIIADTRYITKYGNAMIHELSAGNSGRYTQLVSYTEHLTEIHNKLMDIYLEKTPKSREELELLLKRDSWYDAEGYLENGFVDEIK
jgi:ATP-dependent protease ClpP protease subunit